jgi:branched-chain amino acid aminotransferase
VITPIAELKGESVSIVMPEPAGERVAMSLRQELTDIQYGRVPDRHGWNLRLDG